LEAVFRSPMAFFQSVPHGRLMNRFSKDINLMDETLPAALFDFVQCFFLVLACMIIAVAIIPFSLVALPFVLIGFYYLRKYYMITARQIKRFESITRSPVYSSVPSTLEGLSVIRAFGAQTRFLHSFNRNQDENTRIVFAFISISHWLGFRLDMMAAVIVTLITFACVLLRFNLNITAGSIGLLLTYILQLTNLLQ
jgi:ATP-binding cassette, subfamily C (CFTR/MRP), member 4